MSREEAAVVYLDVMLGFRSGYNEFQLAATVLDETDKRLLDTAVAPLAKKQ